MRLTKNKVVLAILDATEEFGEGRRIAWVQTIEELALSVRGIRSIRPYG